MHPRLTGRPRAGDDGGCLVAAGDRLARCFFDQVQLHRELADLAFQCSDLRFILGDDAGFGFFIIEFAAIELRQP